MSLNVEWLGEELLAKRLRPKPDESLNAASKPADD
jgi:hypothetical protein